MIDSIVNCWELELRKIWEFTQIDFVNLSSFATHGLHLMQKTKQNKNTEKKLGMCFAKS